jgi:RNA polymerase sigma factor (TIGR02999 family)
MKAPADISALLAAWSDGDQAALNDLIPEVYPELRRVARRHLGRCTPHETLDSAAVINEVYLKLVQARGLRCENRAHFFATCAQIIRRILVDHARTRQYIKRGGDAVQVSLDEALLGTRAKGVEILALDQAVTSLSKLDSRKAQVVELRFFGGLSVEETAAFLQISVETVYRDWRMAKTWLHRELTGKADGTA